MPYNISTDSYEVVSVPDDISVADSVATLLSNIPDDEHVKYLETEHSVIDLPEGSTKQAVVEMLADREFYFENLERPRLESYSEILSGKNEKLNRKIKKQQAAQNILEPLAKTPSYSANVLASTALDVLQGDIGADGFNNLHAAAFYGTVPDMEQLPLYQQVTYDIVNAFPEILMGVTTGPVGMGAMAMGRSTEAARESNLDNPLSAYAEGAKVGVGTYLGGKIAGYASNKAASAMAGQRVSTMMQNMGPKTTEGIRRFVEATAATIAGAPAEFAMDWETIAQAEDKQKAFWRVALNSIVFGLADLGATSKAKQIDLLNTNITEAALAQSYREALGKPQVEPSQLDIPSVYPSYDTDALVEGVSDAVKWIHEVAQKPEFAEAIDETFSRPKPEGIFQDGELLLEPYNAGDFVEALKSGIEAKDSDIFESVSESDSAVVIKDGGKVEASDARKTSGSQPEPQTVADKTKQMAQESARAVKEESSGSNVGIVANTVLIDGLLGKALSKTQTKIRDLTRRGGKLGQAVWDDFQRNLDASKKEMLEAKGNFRELKRELKTLNDGRTINLWDDSDPVARAINDVLDPENYAPKTDTEVAEATKLGDFMEYASIKAQRALDAQANKSVTNRVLKMRDHINAMQRKMLDTDLLKQEFGDDVSVKAVISKTGVSKEEAMRQVVESSIGAYVRRTYKKHRQKNWHEKVPDDVREAARDVIESHYGEEYKKLAEETGDNYDELIDRKLDHFIKDPGDKGLLKWARGATEVAVDKTSLKKRIEFLEREPALRKAMGEDSDPITRYFETIRSLSNMVHKQQFLEKLDKDFKGLEVFDKKMDADGLVKIENPRLGPIHGKFAKPEFVKALIEAGDGMSPYGDVLLDGWRKLNGYTKLSLTVLSPAGMVRNFMTMPSWALAQGHWGFSSHKHFKEAFGLTRSHLNADASWLPGLMQLKNRDAQIAKLQQWVERGVVDSSVHVGDILEYVKMVGGNPMRFTDIVERAKLGKLQDEEAIKYAKRLGVTAAQGTVKTMTKLYEAADLIWKINAAEHELANIRKAYKGDDGWTEQALLDEAARKVRLTWPSRSEVIPIANKLRGNILIAPFATWASEVYRTNLNTLKLIHQELGDPRTKPIAYKRMAGLSALYTVLPAAIAAINNLVTNEKEQQAYRFFSPDWDKTAGWLHIGRSTLEKGAKAVNLRNLFFPEQIMEAVRVMYLGREEPEQAFRRSFGRTIAPFIQPEIFFQVATEAFVGTTKEGYPVYESNDLPGERIAKGLDHIYQTGKPGLFKSIERMLDPQRNQKEEIAAFVTGQRMVNSSITTGLGYKGRDYRALLYEIGSEFSGAVRATKDPKEWAQAWRDAELAQLRAWSDMRNAYKHAMNAGMSRKQFYSILVDGKPQLGKAKAEQLILGRYTPFDPIRTLKNAKVSSTTAKAIIQQIRLENKQLSAQRN